MIHVPRRLSLAMGSFALAAAACGPAAPSVSPSGPPPASPSAVPSVVPTASPVASATTAPVASSSQTAACALNPETGDLPSDRFTDIRVSTNERADSLTFEFGNASLEPAGPPKGSLQVATPPYTHAASGLPIDMTGDHVLQVRFSGMSLSNDVGQETYKGPPEVTPDLPALRRAVMYDATEGIVGWYVGYDGPGCVTLVRIGNDVTLRIDHP